MVSTGAAEEVSSRDTRILQASGYSYAGVARHIDCRKGDPGFNLGRHNVKALILTEAWGAGHSFNRTYNTIHNRCPAASAHSPNGDGRSPVTVTDYNPLVLLFLVSLTQHASLNTDG